MAIVINYTVGDPGAPSDGSSNYFNPVISGKKIKVFREGQYQYKIGQNFIIDSGFGTILFSPAQWQGERIRIQAT